MIEDAVARMYSVDDANRFLEVTYQNGDKEVLYFKDFSSGAMIENIVRRTKKLSIKRQIEGGDKGISTRTCSTRPSGISASTRTCRTRPTPTTGRRSPGKKGERIVFVRTLMSDGAEAHGGRQIERVTTGQYL